LGHHACSMDMRLEKKVALVTGGAAGIGAAIVRLLVQEGACVAFADQNEAAGKALAAELANAGGAIRFIKANLARDLDCRRCVVQTTESFGALDLLINNAGANDGIGLEESPAQFIASLQRNLVPVFSVTHYALEALKKSRGAIVNISSKVAFTGQGHTSGYAAAKGGVNALTREWAAALAPHGVRVNCVIPAECDTSQYQRWLAAQNDPDAALASIEHMIPLEQRLTTPEEIAAAVVFLVSPRSSHTTGQLLVVDGGYTHLDRALTQSGHQWKS
jgi:L-fucose dehydrogenase